MRARLWLSPSFFSIPNTCLLSLTFPLFHYLLRKFSEWREKKCKKNPPRILLVTTPPSPQHLEKFQFKRVKYVARQRFFLDHTCGWFPSFMYFHVHIGRRIPPDNPPCVLDLTIFAGWYLWNSTNQDFWDAEIFPPFLI